MKGKGLTWLVVGLVVAIAAVGLFGSYKVYKRYKAKKFAAENQRWEMTNVTRLSRQLEGEELIAFIELQNEKMDRYEVLRPVIDELELMTVWNLTDPDEALQRLKEASEVREGAEPGTLHFVVSDKDKEMTGKLAQAISKSFKAMELRDSLRAPLPPPGYSE